MVCAHAPASEDQMATLRDFLFYLFREVFQESFMAQFSNNRTGEYTTLCDGGYFMNNNLKYQRVYLESQREIKDRLMLEREWRR